jgi:hypothetical protein
VPRNRSEITLVQVLLAAPVSTAVGAPPGLVTFVTALIASISVAPTVIWVIASVRAMFARQSRPQRGRYGSRLACQPCQTSRVRLTARAVTGGPQGDRSDAAVGGPDRNASGNACRSRFPRTASLAVG